MGKKTPYSDSDTDIDNDYGDFDADDELDFDTDDFFEKYSKSTRTKGQRSRDARRIIELYREERELRDRINDYHYHTEA